MAPCLYITASPDVLPEALLQRWSDEGYAVSYLSYEGGGRAYKAQLEHLADGLEAGEGYGLVAYGDAAAACLEVHASPTPKLRTLVAYYPTSIPSPKTKYPPHLQVLVHLAASQNFAPAFPSYTYEGVQPGFAEEGLETFDKVAASLAWTRTLGTVRSAFKTVVDLERVWEEHVALEFVSKDAAATMATMVAEPYVNHVPTLTGGVGQAALFRFCRDHFIPGNPPSLTMRLVSRTIGVDRVVDEMVLAFRHTQEMPWMLPAVPPTDRDVEVALVSVVCIRGGKLYHEHIYWDQASVLVQVGLLDPKAVPQGMRDKGMTRLPVVGAESARKVLNEKSVPSNELMEK
ncbi:hypothetical protein B0A49_04803 [Cryomyces minteri]|uniref:SnoaL-like domain-containing protein n=1 Tax=Cryomyces minteri TaxID=331657 RepID=A0A4V5NIA4_9PEZI|nr:hypothetical protein B0A49_04803 [Cryomyces minteri]